MLDVCSNILLFHEIYAWNIMQVSAYLCKENVYLYNIMINRKLWGIFEFSLAHFAQTSYLFAFCFLDFSLILDKLQKTET